MTIGELIKTKRIEKGLSQDELARLLGYNNRSTIARIEGGYNGVAINKIQAVSDLLDIPKSQLMGWEVEEIEHIDIVEYQISEQDKKLQEELLEQYNKLNTLGKKEANKRVGEMADLPKYTKGE